MSYFLTAIIITALLTWFTRRVALKFGIVDAPDNLRKRHQTVTPLLGGLGIWAGFWMVAGYLVFFTQYLGPNLRVSQLLSLFLATTILLVMGIWDDARSLSARWRLLITAAAVLLIMVGGVRIDKVTNPFGGIFYLDFWQIKIGALATIVVVADILVFFWILGMIYAAKILDGLDGLTTGAGAIGALMIFLVANGERWYQPDVALLALVFCGACLGFLLFNFHPAKIFLGESGSLIIGAMLGALSVISGGKFATALLVMAVPILDLGWVIAKRIARGQPIFTGDREHLHFRLLDAGVGHRRAVLLYYLFFILFGLATVFFQSIGKVAVLLALFTIIIVIEFLSYRFKK